jgi:predicted RNase H-like HicB family nuclease
MLTAYIGAAMRRAEYEKLEDGSYYGEIAGLEGVYADAASLEACRAELQSALEDWILFGLANGFPLPPIDGIELSVTRVA